MGDRTESERRREWDVTNAGARERLARLLLEASRSGLLEAKLEILSLRQQLDIRDASCKRAQESLDQKNAYILDLNKELGVLRAHLDDRVGSVNSGREAVVSYGTGSPLSTQTTIEPQVMQSTRPIQGGTPTKSISPARPLPAPVARADFLPLVGGVANGCCCDGRWSLSGGEVCTIQAGTLTWPSGERVAVSQDRDRLSMVYRGARYAARLKAENGRGRSLEWDDGDTWQYICAPTSRLVVGLSPARSNVAAAPPLMPALGSRSPRYTRQDQPAFRFTNGYPTSGAQAPAASATVRSPMPPMFGSPLSRVGPASPFVSPRSPRN